MKHAMNPHLDAKAVPQIAAMMSSLTCMLALNAYEQQQCLMLLAIHCSEKSAADATRGETCDKSKSNASLSRKPITSSFIIRLPFIQCNHSKSGRCIDG
jgi:hypothetical protein